MANKPITMLRLRRIIQLKERGYSNREIAGKLHLARDTVNEYVNRILSCGKNNTELLKLNEEQLALLVFDVKPEPIKDDRYLDLQSRMGYFPASVKNYLLILSQRLMIVSNRLISYQDHRIFIV